MPIARGMTGLATPDGSGYDVSIKVPNEPVKMLVVTGVTYELVDTVDGPPILTYTTHWAEMTVIPLGACGDPKFLPYDSFVDFDIDALSKALP